MPTKNKKRPDGRLQAKVYIGINKDGKKQYKYVYAPNSRELEKKVQEVKLKLGKGLDVSAERDTFGAWGEKWLKLKKSEVSAGRYATYCARYKNLSDLCTYPIGKIRTSDLQDIILNLASEPSERTGKPYAKYTLNEIKNVAAQIIQLAIENRVLDYNCALAVKIPKAAKSSTRRALTDEEQQWILETPHRAQTAAMIMLYAGLRRGELLALTWEDIDLTEGTINVTKSVEMIDGKPHIKEGGKTSAATRTVYIPKVLISYLEGVPHSRFSLVCPNSKGKPMSSTGWKRLWGSYLCDLNLKYGNWQSCLETNGKKPGKYDPTEKPMLIPEFTAHWLRHTYITLLYKAGVDVLTAKEQAGHSDISTTMGIYTHLDAEYKKKSMAKLDIFLGKDSERCQRGVSG
ncbi:MAG: site-specific integrase [Firmicutes bacterium]|nr:site-specific integrase [[Eubacterium] siraeum]MCM1486833.1 site-specific integrase [Bacillota bacterium]